MTISNSRSWGSLGDKGSFRSRNKGTHRRPPGRAGMDIFLGNSMGRFLLSFLGVIRSVKLARPVNTVALASQTQSFLDSRTISFKTVVGRERGIIGLKDRLDKLPCFLSQRVAHHFVAAGSLHDTCLPDGLKMSTERTLAEFQRIYHLTNTEI